jgi:hypothetical protein
MATKKAAPKKKNKPGVKNSLVNNINARKKKASPGPKRKALLQRNNTKKWKKTERISRYIYNNTII